jgi:pimeloyl-ACP methyl ester carboxylesterase
MKSGIATLNGVTVHYGVEGRGPDVLMVHGWSGSRRMWAHLSGALSPYFRCWSLDLPGFGDSDKPANGWYSIPNYRGVVSRFVETVGLRDVRLIGHSMGALIGLDFTATHPDCVSKLVVINPVVTGRAYMARLAGWKPGPLVLDNTLRLSRRFVQPVLRHQWSKVLHPGVRYLRQRNDDFSRATLESLFGSGRAVVGYDVLGKLPRIAAETLVILGTLDTTVPNSEGHLVAVEVPRARLVVLNAGHLVTDDRPAQTLRVIREFFV